MSAIAGIVALEGGPPPQEQEVGRMLEAMRPRVPATASVFRTQRGRAVAGRLAFGPDRDDVQTASGTLDGPRAFVVGEIYNDDAPAARIADYLVGRYRAAGADTFAAGLNGSFAAVIVDAAADAVTLVTDHTCSRPIFTLVHGGRLYFASQVRGITALGDVPCEPDDAAILSLSIRGFFVDRHTLVRGVRQMDYATLLHVRDGQVQSRPYWRYEFAAAADRGWQRHRAEFTDLLRQAVRRRTRSGRIAILLSGGADSRGIVSFLEDPASVPAVSYTGRTPEARHHLGDCAIAAQCARAAGMRHIITPFDPRQIHLAIRDSVELTDGAACAVSENIWERVREETGAEYLLRGDECLGWCLGPMTMSQVPASVGIRPLRSEERLASSLRPDRVDSFAAGSEEDIRALMNGLAARTAYDCVDRMYFEQRLIHYLESKTGLVPHFGMSARTPWLDLDVMNYVRALPLRYRMRKGLFVDAIRRADPRMSAIPRAQDDETVNFRPYVSAAENEERAYSRIILEDNPLVADYFDPSAVEQLIRSVAAVREEVAPKAQYPLHRLLPRPLLARLRGLKWFVMGSSYRLSGVNLLLRIATIAIALRHLRNRLQITGAQVLGVRHSRVSGGMPSPKA